MDPLRTLTLLHRHRLEALVFVSVFAACSYFYNGYGWNQTARYDAIWAFVEPGPHRGTFVIDDFLTDPEEGANTRDWARNPDHGPHYYANKAPGTSLVGVPFYFTLYHVERALGADPTTVRGVLVNAYLINLWVSVVPVALSAVFFLHLALRYTHRRRRALLLTGILYGGTLILPFSTMMWAHTTAAAFAVMALALFVRPERWAWVAAGALVGLAVLTDYGAAPVALLLFGAATLGPEPARRAGLLALGGLPMLITFVAYHGIAFGAPFSLASSFSPSEMVSQDRLLDLFGAVNPSAIRGLTFSAYRGLFVYMPVLLLALAALRRIPDSDHRDRHVWGLAGAVIVVVFLINTTFNGWHGGTTTGPRYQIMALPFWVLLLALLPDTLPMRRALCSLAALSAVNMLVIASVSPMAPDAFRGSSLLFCWFKLWQVLRIDLGIDPAPVGGSLSRGSLHIYPTFLMRDWAVSLQAPVMERWAAFNLGERLFGLRGLPSLLPLLGVLGGTCAWAAREASARDALPGDGGADESGAPRAGC